MSDVKNYVIALLSKNGIEISAKNQHLLDEFTEIEGNIEKVNQIFNNQNEIMQDFRLKNRLHDINTQHVHLPNAMVGKAYEATVDLSVLGWDDFIFFKINGLDEIGLSYSETEKKIQGIPASSGDLKLVFQYKLAGDSETAMPHEKLVSLVINPDPKSLWKNIPSNQQDPYWKADEVTAFGALGEKHIVVASKRGRSHANVGSFRDDDFAFAHFPENDWSVVAVSDGAGSAKCSRKGSELAVNGIVDYFRAGFTPELLAEFDAVLKESQGNEPAEAQKKISAFAYKHLGGAALSIHKQLEEFAVKNEIELKDLHSTLIFALFKKYDFGYVVLTFGVGDCPIGVMNMQQTEIKLMNWLDVGEYGGGTRFITMPEIFSSDKFSSRIGFRIFDDFSYLFLMTDGIYDPKFVVEANLEKIENWKTFLHDLKGVNDTQTGVNFDPLNPAIESELSEWMDFWSPGNHDDRTLAVIF